MPVSVNVEFDLEKGAVPLNTLKEVPAIETADLQP